MGDVGDTFRWMNEEGKKRRGKNRAQSAKLLEERGIEFISRNNGAHLIINSRDGLIDFWPGTGRWKIRTTGKTAFGVKKLITLLNKGGENEKTLRSCGHRLY